MSLVDAIGKRRLGRRLAYLVREAEAETREALEPFGYYSPTITVERTRVPDAPVTVTISVLLGDPVRVRNFDVGIDGEGAGDRYLRQELDAFKPTTGEVFDHAIYEVIEGAASPAAWPSAGISMPTSPRAGWKSRARTRPPTSSLRWNSGMRYDMGKVTFAQTPRRIVRDACSASWSTGTKASTTTRAAWTACANRWRRWITSRASTSSRSRRRRSTGRCRSMVTLTPAKRDVYTAGLSYGTDSGAGVRFGLERRYVNDRGHKALAQIDYAQRRRPRRCSTACRRSRGSMAGTRRACSLADEQSRVRRHAHASNWWAAAAAKSIGI